jgi:hypothetical protein
VTRYSFKFISIQEPVVPTFVISDHHLPFLFSSAAYTTSPSSPKEEEPMKEGPKDDRPMKAGPIVSFASLISYSPSPSLSASINNYVQSLASSDSSPAWGHIPLPYSAAPKPFKNSYNYVGRTFQDKSYKIVDIGTSSAPRYASVICFKFSYTYFFCPSFSG